MMSGRTDPPVRSSTFEIKRRLLRAAWDGTSKYTPREMITLINERYKRAQEMPVEHIIALAQADADKDEPRSVRVLNLLERERAKQSPSAGNSSYTRWTTKDILPPPGSTLH